MLATAHGFWTAIMLLIFIGIVVWAWSSRRRDDFERVVERVGALTLRRRGEVPETDGRSGDVEDDFGALRRH